MSNFYEIFFVTIKTLYTADVLNNTQGQRSANVPVREIKEKEPRGREIYYREIAGSCNRCY